MTTFTIERKMKEIGIRKVLGARINQLVWLVNQRFLPIALVSGIISIPLVYYFIDQWLGSFAYRMSIGAGSFLLAGIIVLLIVLITVSIQAFRAGLINPVKTLRAD